MFMMMLLIEVVIKNYYYTVENKGNSKTIRAGKRLRIYSSDESSQEQQLVNPCYVVNICYYSYHLKGTFKVDETFVNIYKQVEKNISFLVAFLQQNSKQYFVFCQP